MRQRLRGIWPQARPVPEDDIEAWRWLDANSPSAAPPDEGSPGSGQPDGGQPPSRPPAGRAALGAFDPGRRGARALALVAVVVVLVAWVLLPLSTVAPSSCWLHADSNVAAASTAVAAVTDLIRFMSPDPSARRVRRV